MVKYRGLMPLLHHKRRNRKTPTKFVQTESIQWRVDPALAVKQIEMPQNKLSVPQQWLAAFSLPSQDKPSLLVTATSRSGMTHSHSVACHKPFLALNLIILHKANPKTRGQISHQICSKLFSFNSKTSQGRCKPCWFLKGCWELTRTLKLPTLSFSWKWEQEPTKKTSRAELFIEKEHFFSTLSSPTQYQWTSNDSAGMNQVSEGKSQDLKSEVCLR